MLTYLQLETGCEDYSFWDKAVEDFGHGLDSTLMDSVDTPELIASLDEAPDIPSSVSSGFLCLVSIVSDTSGLQLASSIKSHKLWCQARALLFPVPQAGKMSTFELIHYFSGHSVAFGFQASLPPDNINLNPTNKRIDQSF